MMMMMMIMITHSSSFIRKRSKKDYLSCKIMAILKTVKSAGIDHGTDFFQWIIHDWKILSICPSLSLVHVTFPGGDDFLKIFRINFCLFFRIIFVCLWHDTSRTFPFAFIVSIIHSLLIDDAKCGMRQIIWLDLTEQNETFNSRKHTTKMETMKTYK